MDTSVGVKLRRIVYENPADDKVYTYLTYDFTLPAGISVLFYKHRWDEEKVFNPRFLLNAVDPYEMGILFQKALQSRFHLSLVFMDGHMLRQSMSGATDKNSFPTLVTRGIAPQV